MAENINELTDSLSVQLDYIIQGTDPSFVASIDTICIERSPSGNYLLRLSNESRMNFSYSLEDSYLQLINLINKSLNSNFHRIAFRVRKGLNNIYREFKIKPHVS